MSDKDVELKISADSAQAEAAFGRVGNAGKKAAYELSESFEKISSKMENVNKLFEKMAGLLALGFVAEKIVEGARHIAEYADEVDKSSQKTGIAAEKLQELQFAAKMSDISAKDLDGSLKKLAKAMEGAGAAGNKGADAFDAVGIKASDLKNMKTDEVLIKISDAFAKSKDGAGKAAIAMELFGKQGVDMIPFLNKGSGSIKELSEQAQKMGIVMSGEALDSAGQLDNQFKLMDAQIEGLQRRVSINLVPAFLQITNAFSQSTEQGGAMAGVFDGLGNTLIFITEAASYVAELITIVGIAIGGLMAAIVAAQSGGFSAFKKVLKDVGTDIEESTKKFTAFRDTLEKPVNAPASPKMPGEEGKNNLSLRGAGSQINDWKAELEAKKEAEGSFFKSSMRDDEIYWNTKLTQVRKGSKDEAAVRHELYAVHKQLAVQLFADQQAALKTQMDAAHAGGVERVTIATQIAKRVGETYGLESKEYMDSLREIKKVQDDFDKEQQKLGSLRVDRARDHSVAMIDMERDQLGLKKELGQVSELEEIEQLKQMKEREYQIEIQAQQDKIALQKEEGSAKQQQLDELAKMQDKHNAEIAKLDIKSIEAYKNKWSTILGAVNSAFEKSITGMIMGTQSWQQSLANINQAMLAEFVSLGVKRVTGWIANEAAMLFASKAKDTAVGVSGAVGATTAVATKGTEATAVVSANAAEAAGGAAASQAAIPVVGPGLAFAAFAATLALVLGAKSLIKSSAGGEWQVPTDRLNIVHKDETILPAHIATPLRSMIEGGGNMGGGDIHFHGQGGDFIHKNDLAKVLKQMNRNFVFHN